MPYEPPAAAAQLHCEGTPPNSSWGIDEGEGLGPQGLKGVGCGVGTGLHAKCSVSF